MLYNVLKQDVFVWERCFISNQQKQPKKTTLKTISISSSMVLMIIMIVASLWGRPYARCFVSSLCWDMLSVWEAVIIYLHPCSPLDDCKVKKLNEHQSSAGMNPGLYDFSCLILSLWMRCLSMQSFSKPSCILNYYIMEGLTNHWLLLFLLGHIFGDDVHFSSFQQVTVTSETTAFAMGM